MYLFFKTKNNHSSKGVCRGIAEKNYNNNKGKTDTYEHKVPFHLHLQGLNNLW